MSLDELEIGWDGNWVFCTLLGIGLYSHLWDDFDLILNGNFIDFWFKMTSFGSKIGQSVLFSMFCKFNLGSKSESLAQENQ